MKSFTFTLIWVACAAGFIYYPGIVRIALSEIDRINRFTLRNILAKALTRHTIFGILLPLVYFFALKLSIEAFDYRFVIEAYLWIIPPAFLSGLMFVFFGRRRRRQYR